MRCNFCGNKIVIYDDGSNEHGDNYYCFICGKHEVEKRGKVKNRIDAKCHKLTFYYSNQEVNKIECIPKEEYRKQYVKLNYLIEELDSNSQEVTRYIDYISLYNNNLLYYGHNPLDIDVSYRLLIERILGD